MQLPWLRNLADVKCYMCAMTKLILNQQLTKAHPSTIKHLLHTKYYASAPLNSKPVIGYRKGGVTPIWSPAWSGGYIEMC